MFAAFAPLPTPSPSPTGSADAAASAGWAAFFAIDVSQAFQIAFWIVAGTIAVLTYWQARRTVFQPLRLEVFKQQLAVLTRVSEDFVSRDEMSLRQYFDLENCVNFNASLMFEEFLEDVHGLKRKKPLLEEFREDFPGGFVSLESMEANFELVTAPGETPSPSPASEDLPTAGADTAGAETGDAKRQEWDHYSPRFIAVSREYSNAHAHVLSLVRDPLVPRELAVLLEELADTANANLHAIEPALTEAAQKLTTAYPKFDSGTDPHLSWVSNIWNRKATPLEPVARRIGAFTRDFVEAERSGFLNRRNRRPSRSTSESP